MPSIIIAWVGESLNLARRAVTSAWHHHAIISKLAHDHLISLALLPQPHDFGFQHLDLLNEINALVAFHFLELLFHRIVDRIIFLNFVAELFVHPFDFLLLELQLIPQLNIGHRASDLEPAVPFAFLVFFEKFCQLKLHVEQLLVVHFQFFAEFHVLLTQIGEQALLSPHFMRGVLNE